MDIRYEIEKNISSIIELRREFHRIPELGYEEFKTSAKITSYLEELGLNVFHYNGTGLAAVINSENDGPMLMLRADIDALAGNEETGLPSLRPIPVKCTPAAMTRTLRVCLERPKYSVSTPMSLKGAYCWYSSQTKSAQERLT